jgi:hypothetical protein
MLKKIAIGLGALVALVLIASLLMPSKWHVERTVVVKAKGDTLAPLIATPKRWQEWAAWNNKMDPESRWEYSGPDTGVGAVMSWKGPKLGEGVLTITQVDPVKGVFYKMVMEKGTPAEGGFAFTAEKDGTTRVVWTDEGDMGMNLPGRLFVPMMEKMLSEHFDIGLKNLQGLAEAAQVTADKAAAEAKLAEEKAAAEAAAAGTVPAGGAAADEVQADAAVK